MKDYKKILNKSNEYPDRIVISKGNNLKNTFSCYQDTYLNTKYFIYLHLENEVAIIWNVKISKRKRALYK